MSGTIQIDDIDPVVAPDGLRVRPLLAMEGGSMAEFRLPAHGVGHPIRHATIEEIWHVTDGSGQIWREGINGGDPVDLAPGTCVSIPPRTVFQIRAGSVGLVVIAVTMPPWPGNGEAEVLEGAGPWVPVL